MRITVIGHGRVGTHLYRALLAAGHDVLWASGRHLPPLRPCDIALIAVTDSALPSVARQLCHLLPPDVIVAHTAGSIGIEVFQRRPMSGVLYPMQTFSKERDVDFTQIPVFIEANCPEARQSLTALAASLSRHVTYLTSHERRRLHVAAVFACNFVNHCVTLADDVLRPAGLDYRTMLPLLRETISKLDTLSPTDAQTGPAIRADHSVMEEHQRMLDNELSKEIYRLMSLSIQEHQL